MSLAPARGRLREGTSGVDRSQAALCSGASRPRRGDWSDLWLDVIMRRLATSDRRMVTAAECVYSTWQFNPLPGGATRGEALCGSRLTPQPVHSMHALSRRPGVPAGVEAGSLVAICEETAADR